MMKKLLAAFAVLALAFSCTKTEVVELTVSPLAVNFDVAGGEQALTITCNDHWTVTKTADWITVSVTSGDGNGSVKISAPENKALDAREADVTVAAGEIKRVVKVSQLGKTPVLTVEPLALNVGDKGGELEVTVTSNIAWTVTIPAEAGWVTADKSSAEGSAVVKFTVAANEGLETREAEIGFAGAKLSQVVKLSQMGQEPFLGIDKQSVDAPYEGGQFAVAITSNVPWTVTIPEDAAWITADKLEGEGDATVTLTVENNIYLTGRNAVVVFAAGESLVSELPVAQQAGVPSHASDSLALVKIYTIADGAAWKESRVWDLTKPISEWPGIKLDDNGRVIEMSITNGTVSTVEWEIPEELSTLNALKTLQIVGSKLKGEIPAFLYDMTTLEVVRLNSNDLTGSLSDKLGQLTNLTDLYINLNKQFGGTIPATIGQLKNLVSINIAQTAISGEIPQALAQCSSLKNFMAWGAQLSGEIPDFWDQLPNIGVLQLYGNEGITGPIPASIGSLKKATGIQLKECNLTGNIPASFGGLEKCSNLMLNGNKLSGVVPAEVQAHPKWQATSGWKYETNILPQQDGYGLLLGYNHQTDSLALVKIYTIADGANWKESRRWDPAKPISEWPGIKLDDDGRVIEMSITNGTVSTVEWEIPEELATLDALKTLQIVGSKLKGEIPAFFYDMTTLEVVRLNTNNLTGALSDKLGQLTNLTDLYINGNKQFGGSIPATIGQLKNLVSINIAQTAIGGAIPAELVGCESLKNFMAYSNKLSGEIPDFWDQLPNIGVLQLYGNPDITGPIPASIGSLKKATGIQLKECNLTGNIPASFGGLEKCSNLMLNGNKLSGVVPAEVQAHPKWQATSGWKYEVNILPQQDGYGLTLSEFNLDGRWDAPRNNDNPSDIAFVALFEGNKLDLYIIAWGQHYVGTYQLANGVLTYDISKAYQAYTDVTFDGEGNMTSWSWMAGDLDASTLTLADGYDWYVMDAESLAEYKENLKEFGFQVQAGNTTATSSLFGIPDLVFTKKN